METVIPPLETRSQLKDEAAAHIRGLIASGQVQSGRHHRDAARPRERCPVGRMSTTSALAGWTVAWSAERTRSSSRRLSFSKGLIADPWAASMTPTIWNEPASRDPRRSAAYDTREHEVARRVVGAVMCVGDQRSVGNQSAQSVAALRLVETLQGQVL